MFLSDMAFRPLGLIDEVIRLVGQKIHCALTSPSLVDATNASVLYSIRKDRFFVTVVSAGGMEVKVWNYFLQRMFNIVEQ